MVTLKFLKKKQINFQEFITDYFETREQLVCAFVLIDIRHEALTLNSCRIWAKVKFFLYRFHQSRQNK
jgi:GTP-binding protein EngB required for normal cell division